jgi:copper transport protein
LGGSIAIELTLAIVILGAVGLWRFTPPPRTLVAAAPTGVVRGHIHTDRGMVDMQLRPGRPGSVTAAIELLGPDYVPLDPKELTLTLANPGAGIEPFERRAKRVREGAWEVRGLVVPVGGRWDVKVDALVSDFEKVTLEGSITMPP